MGGRGMQIKLIPRRLCRLFCAFAAHFSALGVDGVEGGPAREMPRDRPEITAPVNHRTRSLISEFQITGYTSESD